MTLVKNKRTGIWEADIRDRKLPRLHVSLGEKQRAKAEPLHAALVQLVREGDGALVDLVRRRKVNVAEVAACVRARRPFESLRARDPWPTVRQAADDYIAWLAAHPERHGATAVVAATQLNRFAEFVAEHPELGPDARLDQVTTALATAFQDGVLAAYATNTATNLIGRVAALYRWAARREALDARDAGRQQRALECPLDAERRPTKHTRRERFLSREEAARLVAATPAPLLAAIALGLHAGLRVSEALHLRPGVDVDLDRDMVVVQERGSRGEAHHWRPKRGTRREIPIGTDLRPVLERHLAVYASDAYVFPRPSDAARPVAQEVLHVHVRRIVETAGLIPGRTHPEGVTYHTLRHTFASWLVIADVNPYRIAKLLGNSLRMVETTYGHLAPQDNRRAVETLSGAVAFPLLEEEVLTHA